MSFDAWTYRGTDNLWASLLESLWKEVETEFSKDEVSWHRAGVARADLTNISANDTLHVARDRARKQAAQDLMIQWNAIISCLLVFSMGIVAGLIWLSILVDDQLNKKRVRKFHLSLTLAQRFLLSLRLRFLL